MYRLFLLFILLAQTAYAQNLKQGIQQFEAQQWDSSIKTLEAVNKESKEYAEAQYYLGKNWMAKKKYEKASEAFEKAIAKNDKVADYHYMQGAAYGVLAQESNVIKQGYLATKVKSSFEKAAALDSKHLESRTGLVQFYLMAPSVMGGSEEKALQVADDIKKIDMLQGSVIKGNIFSKQKKYSQAEKEYDAACKLSPDSLNNQLGAINGYLTCQSYDKAFDLMDNLIRKNTASPHIYYYFYGKASAVSGKRADKATDYLNRYIKSYTPSKDEPSHAYAYYRLGMIQEKLNNNAEAKAHYQAAIKLDPGNKEATQALKKLKG
jgi:tetratricopeptide (TPR) repeat protein